jgi:hypothetical protein
MPKKQKTEDDSSLPREDERPSDEIGDITLEYAKSGRAQYRCCGQNIGTDSPLVGMEAFITGRVSMTWQHFDCFLKNSMKVEYEKTGRTTCSLTGKEIKKERPKLTLHSHHTAKRSLALCCIPKVLSVLLSWAPSSVDTDVESLHSYLKLRMT